MSKTSGRNGAPARDSGQDDGEQPFLQSYSLTSANIRSTDICPVCKSSRYLNPNMRFLVNPECYHKMCESCVDRIFSQGPAPCPVAGCARTLRKQRFRRQTFEDLQVEREVDIRRRVAAVFNRRQEEFTDLLAYNNYLEEVETVTFNLLYKIDVPETEAKLVAYANQNAPTIAHNVALSNQESANTEAHLAAQKEDARLRREEARKEEDDERREREHGRMEIVNRIAHSNEDPDKIIREGQKVVLKKSTARRSLADKARQQSAAALDNGTAAPLYHIRGLKPVMEMVPAKVYDPFGGVSFKPQYHTARTDYEHEWLEPARSDVQITIGGYDAGDYCKRALVEAFAGLGCFIEDEVSGSDNGSAKGVAAAAAAIAGSGSMTGGDIL